MKKTKSKNNKSKPIKQPLSKYIDNDMTAGNPKGTPPTKEQYRKMRESILLQSKFNKAVEKNNYKLIIKYATLLDGKIERYDCLELAIKERRWKDIIKFAKKLDSIKNCKHKCTISDKGKYKCLNCEKIANVDLQKCDHIITTNWKKKITTDFYRKRNTKD